MKRTLPPAFVIFALLLAAPARADDRADCFKDSGELAVTDIAPVSAACKRLAELGDTEALLRYVTLQLSSLLKCIWSDGQRDNAEATKWCHLAAEQGHAEAQSALGNMYRDGRGVPRDDAEALKWWRKAAEQRFGEAEYNLGLLHMEGRTVPQDNIQAHMWFSLAAIERWPDAAKNRNLLAGKMTPSELSESERLAREWREKYPRKKP